MRALILLAVISACTPEIVPGAYLCGPNAACPEGHACSELDNTCVLPGRVEPFACEPDINSEPDDEPDAAFLLPNLACVTLPSVIESCMPKADPADWIKLIAPSGCSTITLDTTVTFPLAFQRLGIELWDLTANERVATDTDCEFARQGGDDKRCLESELTGGRTYGIRVAPTGEDDCDGDCAFNRYTHSIQLAGS